MFSFRNLVSFLRLPSCRAWLGVCLAFATPATHAATPVVTSFSPDNGRPGTQVTINGSGFSDAAKVEFGDSRVAAFVPISASKLVAVVPADGLSGAIRVTSAGGNTGSSAATFWVAPRIDDFRPRRGSATTTITIDGANFIPNVGGLPYTVVRFGTNISPLVTVTAPSQLQAAVPAGISNTVLTVATYAGAATSIVNFVITTLPVIEETTPKNGLPGQAVPVVIFGANLLSATEVKFNTVTSPFTATADTVINTTIPAGATSGKIYIKNATGTGTSLVDFIVGPTILHDPPFEPAFNPMAGRPGEFVTVYGNTFVGVTNVSFNGVLAGNNNVTLPGNNQVNVRIPIGATTGKVRVLTTSGEAISPIDFTVGPLITSLNASNGQSTNAGPVGSSVTVFGAGFLQPQLAVKFGGVSAPAPVVNADNQFVVTVPAGATNAPLTVSTSYGTNTTPYNFLVTTAVPLIDDFEPKSGPQGTLMQIRGAKFTGATQVTIGGIPVVNPQTTADSLILATVPAGVLSGPVRVTNPSGTGVSTAVFNAPPWITSFTPASAQVSSNVTVRGTNFLGTTAVYFQSEPADILQVTTNEIVLRVTTNARTGPLTLHAPGGAFVTTNQFVVLPKITDFQPRLGPVGSTVAVTGTSFYNVTNVTFNGVKAVTYTVVSPQQVNVTVPAGATTGLIRVFTTDGIADSPLAFTVTLPGDLRVTEMLSTTVAVALEPVIYTSTITNAGPSIQTGVVFTNRFDDGIVVASADASQGGCAIDGLVVNCALGTITNGELATVTITASAAFGGVFTNRVTVSSIEGDPLPADNALLNTLVVATPDQRTLTIDLLSAPDRVVVRWPISAVPFKLQRTSVPGDPNVAWTNITPLPPPTGGTNRFTNTAPTAAGEYYRLRFP